MNRILTIAVSTVLFTAARGAAAASWVPAGPAGSNFGVMPVGEFGMTTIGSNVIAGNETVGLYPDLTGGQTEFWNGSSWVLVDQTLDALASSTDFNGNVWEVRDPVFGQCPNGFGHAYYYGRSELDSFQWEQLDAAHPQCISSLAVGNVCVNFSSPIFGASPPAGCNDDEIFGVGPGGTIYQWQPSSSSWAAATQYTGSDTIAELALSPDTGCGGAPNLWALDTGFHVWEVPSEHPIIRLDEREATAFGVCTRNWVSQQPPGCATSPGTLLGAYSITTDYAQCNNDVYHWTGSAWQALGVGACPSAFIAADELPLDWDQTKPLYPQIGASPGQPLMCWGGGPTANQGQTGHYIYQLN